MTTSPREAGVIIAHLSRALLDGTRDLGTVPALVVRIVEDELWTEWADPASGREYGPFDSFEEFVTAPAAEGGLGITVKMLMDLCRSDPVAMDAIIEETRRPHGGDRGSKNNNITLAPTPQGTSAAKALRRLRKARPDLHERVLAREMTPHAAMIEAGFRHKAITVRLDDPASVARTLRRHMSDADLALLRGLLDG